MHIAIGKGKVESNLIFVLVVILMSFHILSIAHIDVFPIAGFRLISMEHLPWFDTMDPKI